MPFFIKKVLYIMYDQIKNEAYNAFSELIEAAKLEKGSIIVIGCSTSEIAGDKIGTHSNVDIAKALYDGFYPLLKEKGIYLAAQCCEHLNRALVIEKELADRLGIPVVNAVPQPKAGGSSATTAYSLMEHPVLVEHIKADAGIDIGRTLIGMHLKETAVPLRLKTKTIGEASITSARTRAKYIGGIRTVYNEELL